MTSKVPRGGELLSALAELTSVAQLTNEELAGVIEQALLAAYRHAGHDDMGAEAHVDLVTGTFTLSTRDETGEVIPVATDSADFVRHVVHTTKGALAHRFQDIERGKIHQAVAQHYGQLADAIVEKREGAAWRFTCLGVDAVLPREEQIPGEQFRPGQHVAVMVLESRIDGKDPVLGLSRSHPQLLRLILEQEVPEIANGQVVVRGIAREAGRRSKVAVFTPDGVIDAQGACIGPRGVRHRAVTEQLGEEQVQIVSWSDDPSVFVSRALTPATVQTVTIDVEHRTAHVEVVPEQLSLAIGKSGENARLAAKLTGWRIDIGPVGGANATEAETPA